MKDAIEVLIQYLANALASQGITVTVNVITSGAIETNFDGAAVKIMHRRINSSLAFSTA